MDDLTWVFEKLGPEARPLSAPAVERHLAARPGDWAKWLGDGAADRRLFALVHADLSKDAARPALIAARLSDDDRRVRLWALVRLRSFVAPTHAAALFALLQDGKRDERREALALLSTLSEPPAILAAAAAIEMERGEPSLIAAALALCERFPAPLQAPALVARARKDDDPSVRFRAADLLARRKDGLHGAALHGIARALRGERDGGVARIEADLLCARKAHLEGVYAAALHPDAAVADVALRCLSEHGGAPDWRFARKAVRRSVPGAESAASALWLRALVTEGAVAAAPLLDDLSASVSFFSAGWAHADPEARAALGVAGAAVRRTRTEALRRLEIERLGADPAVRALATELVSDRDVNVRLAALDLLSRASYHQQRPRSPGRASPGLIFQPNEQGFPPPRGAPSPTG